MSEYITWENHYNNIRDARDDGFEIVYADDHTLLLDLDTDEQLTWFNRVIETFQKNFQVKDKHVWFSKSGNTHIALELSKPISIELRIAMQAILGSDPVRSICQIKQVLTQANPIALFKPGAKDK